MSSANKSSFKPSNPSASGSYEDELLTWLQCPTDDAFERSYCSDVFQEAWPLAASEGAAVKSIPHVVTHEQEGNLSSMGTSTCETGSVPCASLVRKHMATNCKTSLISKSSCNTTADEALARGAARAAGHSSVVGQGAYNKVKTLLQPTHGHPPLSAPRYSFNARKELKDHPIKLNLPVSLVPASAPKPLQNARSMKVNMLESSPLIKTKHTISESATSSSKRARTDYEAHSHTHQTESSRITDEGTIERGKMAAGADRRCTSCSGASQSSMSLSGRETAHSGKHTQEELDILTEDYAEDDSMDVKKRSKHPLKRNRVAEVHNLSERKRRNRINEKLKSLQDLIPNSSKTDKASVLDEAIEYMKTLQMQLQMVSMRNSLNIPTMMMPTNLPQGHMQMSQPHSIGLGVPIGHAAGMGLGLGLGIPEMRPPTTTTLLQYPAGMSQLHAMPFYSGNMAGYAAHMGFLQNTQLSPTMQNMQEPYELSAQAQRPTYMHQHQQYEQGRSLLCQPCNPEHEAVSIEQDDESD